MTTKTCRFPLRRIFATLLALVMIFTSALTLAVPAYAASTASSSAFYLQQKKGSKGTIPFTPVAISKTYNIKGSTFSQKVKVKVGGAALIAADARMSLGAARKYQVQHIYFRVVVKNGDSTVLETDVYPSGTLVTPSASFKLPGVGLFKKKPTYKVTITPCIKGSCNPKQTGMAKTNTDYKFCNYTTYWLTY